MSKDPQDQNIITEIRKALEVEIEGIQGLTQRLGAELETAVRMILDCEGKVIVTGMGKSGHVGNKIAATLASTGTPSFFLHPAEAIHGDLGMVSGKDVVLALSNSGNTEEILRILGPLRRMGVSLISMTGDPDSELAKRCEVHIDVSVDKEACPLNLTPTASTTAAMAMGDALAVCLLSLRNFKAEDYAIFHPGGSLGKKLMTTVRDLMDSGDRFPMVKEDTPVAATVEEIQAKKYGITSVVDAQGVLTGSFSLGDLMRLHINDPSLGFLTQPISQFTTKSPRFIKPDMLAARALNTMETHNIRALFVTDDDQRPIGVIGIYEVLKAIDY